MIGMQMQNAKINDLLAIEKQMQDEKFCCEHITNTCKQIISMGKRSDYSPEIRELVNTLTEVTANFVTYRTNHFVTGADILRGCLA
jgi:AMMECR1 domain-containing protein